jgi:nicotinate-nucleotide pyrophosphorylase
VRIGGGENHRFTLADALLIKDNHLAALRARGLGIADAVRLAHEAAPPEMRVQIEVTSVEEAREALAAGAHELLLDNMSPEDMRRVVELAKGRAVALEASGGIGQASRRGGVRLGGNACQLCGGRQTGRRRLSRRDRHPLGLCAGLQAPGDCP